MKFGENFVFWKKIYYLSQRWKRSTLLRNRLGKKLWSKKKPSLFRKTSDNSNSNLHFHYFLPSSISIIIDKNQKLIFRLKISSSTPTLLHLVFHLEFSTLIFRFRIFFIQTNFFTLIFRLRTFQPPPPSLPPENVRLCSSDSQITFTC